jgi:hypothetical protein
MPSGNWDDFPKRSIDVPHCCGCENLKFVQGTLEIERQRREKAEALNVQYKKAILALIDSMAKD